MSPILALNPIRLQRKLQCSSDKAKAGIKLQYLFICFRKIWSIWSFWENFRPSRRDCSRKPFSRRGGGLSAQRWENHVVYKRWPYIHLQEYFSGFLYEYLFNDFKYTLSLFVSRPLRMCRKRDNPPPPTFLWKKICYSTKMSFWSSLVEGVYNTSIR